MPRKKEQPLGSLTSEVTELDKSLENPNAKVYGGIGTEPRLAPGLVNQFKLSTDGLASDMLSESVAFAGSLAEDAQISVNNLTNAVNSIKKDKFVRNEDGSVNWRAMVNPKYVVINGKYADVLEKKYGKPIGELNPNDIDDRFNLILLAGIKELADLRGFSEVDYDIVEASPDYVLMKCTITWEPFEGKGVKKFSATADASPKNTDDFMSLFLAAAAENRAFIRAVRNFLKIHITGKEEVCPEEKIAAAKNNPAQPPAESKKPVDALKEKLDAKKISFDKFKNWWAKEGNTQALDWVSYGDIPKQEVWAILSRINRAEAEKSG